MTFEAISTFPPGHVVISDSYGSLFFMAFWTNQRSYCADFFSPSVSWKTLTMLVCDVMPLENCGLFCWHKVRKKADISQISLPAVSTEVTAAHGSFDGEWLILLIHSTLKCMHVCFNELRRELVWRQETFEPMSKATDPWCHASSWGRSRCSLDGYFISYCVLHE